MKLIYITQNLQEAKYIHRCAKAFAHYSVSWENVVVTARKKGPLSVYVFDTKEEALRQRLYFDCDTNITIRYGIANDKIKEFEKSLNAIRDIVSAFSLIKSENLFNKKENFCLTRLGITNWNRINEIAPVPVSRPSDKMHVYSALSSAHLLAIANSLLIAANKSNHNAQYNIKRRYIGTDEVSKNIKIAFIEDQKLAVADSVKTQPRQRSSICKEDSKISENISLAISNSKVINKSSAELEFNRCFKALNTPANSPVGIVTTRSRDNTVFVAGKDLRTQGTRNFDKKRNYQPEQRDDITTKDVNAGSLPTLDRGSCCIIA